MELNIYKVKMYNYISRKFYKILVAATSFDAAIKVAQTIDPNGWVDRIRNTDKSVYVKGESEDD